MQSDHSQPNTAIPHRPTNRHTFQPYVSAALKEALEVLWACSPEELASVFTRYDLKVRSEFTEAELAEDKRCLPQVGTGTLMGGLGINQQQVRPRFEEEPAIDAPVANGDGQQNPVHHGADQN